jgi:hypothetical protein
MKSPAMMAGLFLARRRQPTPARTRIRIRSPPRSNLLAVALLAAALLWLGSRGVDVAVRWG